MNPLSLDLLSADDPVRLAERGGFHSYPYQVEVLRSQSKQIILNWSRQAGKSTVTSYLPIHRAQYQANSLILLLGPGERQAELLLDKVYDALGNIGRDAIKTEVENVMELILENGSKIVALPGKEGTIRGFSGVDLIVVDEASRVPDSLYYAVRPMLAASNGSIILLSTPFGKRGFFHKEWTEGTGDWHRMKVIATQVPHISPEFLESERKSLPDMWFQQEYMGEFIETVDQIFGYDLVQSALSDGIEPLFAPQGDAWNALSNLSPL